MTRQRMIVRMFMPRSIRLWVIVLGWGIAGGGLSLAQDRDDPVAAEIPAENDTETAIFAAGCFWCTEAVFELVPGVRNVESGYIGGSATDANYAAVCRPKFAIPGVPMHAEAVRITYDPDRVTFAQLLEVFFKSHDPTSLYKQGPDTGPQYRTSIFYVDEAQKQVAESIITDQNEQRRPTDKIVTLIEDGTGGSPTALFYLAEEKHQDYFRKNPGDAYCRRNALPKIRKTRDLREQIEASMDDEGGSP